MGTLPSTAHPGHDGLTLEDAGRALGLSARTVRRMVRRGELEAAKVDGPRGPQYLVRLPAGTVFPAATVANGVHPGPDHPGHDGHAGPIGHRGQASLVPLVTELTRRVAALEQERFELAGRLGYFQAQLEQARQTIKALEAPKEPAPADPPRRPWWRVWR